MEPTLAPPTPAPTVTPTVTPSPAEPTPTTVPTIIDAGGGSSSGDGPRGTLLALAALSAIVAAGSGLTLLRQG